MPRLVDLLQWLAEAEPGREDVWVLLDIKVRFLQRKIAPHPILLGSPLRGD